MFIVVLVTPGSQTRSTGIKCVYVLFALCCITCCYSWRVGVNLCCMSHLQFLYRAVPSVLQILVVWSTCTCMQPAGASPAAMPSWDDSRYVHRLRLHVNGLRSRHHSRLVNTWFMHCGWPICYLHFLAVCHI